MAYTLFVIGNIASGKSTACRYLASKGARHLDLDVLAKSLYVPGSPIVDELAERFGWDILDADGGIVISALASRAFDSPESVRALNAIVHPAVKRRLADMIFPVACCSTVLPAFDLTVVEISVPGEFRDMFALADGVMAISAPLEERRARAILRGMSAEDFDLRSVAQPSEDELCSWSDFVIDNAAADDSLFSRLDDWLLERGLSLGVEL